MKFKFEKIEGCTAFNFLVNGDSFYDLSEDKQKEIVDYLFERLKEAYINKEVDIQGLCENFSPTDYEYEKDPCDQCGDNVSTTTWEL